jgi:DNA-binding response OmpR family regulator
VDVHVRRLRAKLGEKSHVIETVTGAGYKLVRPAR